MASGSHLPETGFLRLAQIVGNLKANPPIPAIIPISKSSWWNGVRTGKYPKPIKLGPRTTAWNVDDIRDLIKRQNEVVVESREAKL
jgi:predicted DNA-binding transcriptional regulator AlpA